MIVSWTGMGCTSEVTNIGVDNMVQGIWLDGASEVNQSPTPYDARFSCTIRNVVLIWDECTGGKNLQDGMREYDVRVSLQREF